MGKWQHRLKNRDIEKQIADCLFCGDRVRIVKSKVGTKIRWKCRLSRRVQAGGNRKEQWKHRKFFFNAIKRCETCAFEVDDFRFFDVHHKDGNHKNNEFENLQLLCPNCHRLETIETWKKLETKKIYAN